MHEKSGWIVWNFEYKPPHFQNEDIALSEGFPQFANVYHVTCTKKGNQHFLKCDCLLYERCGIPCSHILKITDQVEATMIKIQHWKVFHVHFGLVESILLFARERSVGVNNVTNIRHLNLLSTSNTTRGIPRSPNNNRSGRGLGHLERRHYR